MTASSKFALWRNVVTLVGAGAAIGLSVPALAAPPTYHLVDLGTLGGINSTGSGINASGKVSGNDNNLSAAFRSSGKTQPITLTNLGTLGGNSAQSSGINNGGQVVGSSTINTTGQILTHAFRTTGSTMEDLGTLGGGQSGGGGINNNGQVTGGSDIGNGAYHAFRSTGNGIATALTDLGSPGGGNTSSTGNGINDSGEVAGTFNTGVGFAQHAFRSTGNTAGSIVLTDLGTLGGQDSRGLAINTFGQVVGQSDTVGGLTHAYRSSASSAGSVSLTDLGTLGGDTSSAYGIDTFGDVVGISNVISGGSNHGFLYENGQIYNLEGLVSNLGGLTIQAAYGINDNGDIIAAGGDGVNYEHAFLLTPEGGVTATPEPGTVAMLTASGLGSLVVLRRRRKK